MDILVKLPWLLWGECLWCGKFVEIEVTITSGRTCSGSVTSPLFGATFVDLEPQESNDLYLLIAFGKDVERFCSNSSILEVKGSIGDTIEADVTKWLPERVLYREYLPPPNLTDGSELVQQGTVPRGRSGAQLGIFSKDENCHYYLHRCCL